MNGTLESASLVRQSAVELAALVRRGEVSSAEVVDAHLARIEEVNDRLNAVVVRRYDLARREAAEIDARRRRGETLGPLAGVPISIKECLDVAGTASTLGLSSRTCALAAHDGPLVARLRDAGAVVLAKTNVPQLAMYMETDGPLFGTARNPWNLDRSPGGSSGGEAALIAAGGTPLGLATDAGGSIRQPAHVCGVCGLKPTSGRLTQGDLPVTTVRLGQRFMPLNLAGLHAILQPGPMARHVADLRLAMGVLAAPGQEQFDPTVSPAEWRDAAVDPGALRVGFYEDDGQFSCSPGARRVVREAAEVLRGAGANVRPFAPPRVTHAVAVLQSLILPDGGEAFRAMIAGSRLDPRLARMMQAAALPGALRTPVAWFLERSGQGRLAESVRNLRTLSAHGFRTRLAERARYTAEFLAAMDEAQIDLIVCPPHPVPAPTHGSGAYLGLMASYTALYNLLGFPAGVVGASRVRSGEESDRPASRDTVEQTARAIEQGSAGLPLGVQVVGRPWREDLVLTGLELLETHFRRQSDFPSWPPL